MTSLGRLLKRPFGSFSRLQRLESLHQRHPGSIHNTLNLYEEYLQQGQYAHLIKRFEEAPLTERSRIQCHPQALRMYIQALEGLGKGKDVEQKMHRIFGQPFVDPAQVPPEPAESSRGAPMRSAESDGSPGLARAAGSSIKENGFHPPPAGEPREYWIKTRADEWAQKMSMSQNAPTEPIQVVVSEAFSWAKILRKFGKTVLFWFLIMTSLSIVLEQQGILKSGLALGTEVEPSNMTKPVKFEDVQGVEEAKEELEEVVEFLKEPHKFLELGGKLPKGMIYILTYFQGVLLYGPPGTGKTHLAKAVAGEAGVPFFQISGSEFDELYVGVGARRVRDLFAAAKKKAPCIIFIDELDAVGSARNAKDQSYMRQTLNQLLVELDGFSSSDGVIVIGATNTPNSLDKALVRPGRFDRLVAVPLPDVKGRSRILKVHMKGVMIDPKVDVDVIARGTPGFSGADLANVINHAAIKASKNHSKWVTLEHLEWAKDKIIMGSERKSAVISPESKRITAYHEGGHALVSLYTQGAMPLHKVTIIPRGQALGVTVQLPEGDQTSVTKKELVARLDICMGGRVAEELIFGPDNITTGASSDLEQATRIAHRMVMRFGMSDQFGLASMAESKFQAASSHTRNIVESETKRILDEAYQRASNLLQTHREELDRLADALLRYETLSADEVRKVIKGTYLPDADLSE